METRNDALTIKQQNIITISAFTSKGEFENLKTALNDGLDAGLTFNEINEVIGHLYAYCGFPFSNKGMQLLRVVVKEREANGIKEDTGSWLERDEMAKKFIMTVSAEHLGLPLEFDPFMDTFLKERLFADIFDWDLLAYKDRQLVTISALVSMYKPFLRSYIEEVLNVGVSKEQLQELFAIIESKVGKMEADTSRKILDQVLAGRQGA